MDKYHVIVCFFIVQYVHPPNPIKSKKDWFGVLKLTAEQISSGSEGTQIWQPFEYKAFTNWATCEGS